MPDQQNGTRLRGLACTQHADNTYLGDGELRLKPGPGPGVSVLNVKYRAHINGRCQQ